MRFNLAIPVAQIFRGTSLMAAGWLGAGMA